MSAYNFKRLVSLFLLAATVTGSGAFLFSQFSPVLSSEDDRGGVNGIEESSVFVEPVPEFPLAPPQSSSGELTDADLPSIPDTNNLTEQFAAQFAREFIRANPRGPQVSDAGERTLTSPDESTIEDLILKGVNENSLAELKHPSTPSSPKRIISNPSPEDIAVYLARVDRLVKENFSTARLTTPSSADLLRKGDTLNIARTAVEAALVELQDADVPEPLLSLHGSLMKLLTYQNEDVARAMGNDPLRAYYAFASRDTTYTNTLQAVMREAEKAKKIFDDASARAPLPPSLIAGIFSIPAAHAIGGVGDIVFDPAALGQSLEEFFTWLKDMLLRILVQQIKTQIIQRMVAQVINWIQGGGKPQFVSDWKGFLEDSKQNVIGGIIQEVAPGLCEPFRKFVPAALKPIPQQRALEPPVTCTLDQVVDNIKGFAKDFREGGWVGYFALLQPKNNPWGAALLTQELALRAANNDEEANKNEGISGGGFLSTKICTAPQTVTQQSQQADPNCDPSQQSCAGSNGLSESEIKGVSGYVPGSARCSGGVCTSYQVCAPNGWQVTTPGNAVANITNQAITSPIPNIVSAEDISAIISALIDSALNKLLFSQDAGLAGISTKRRRTPSQPNPEGDFFTEAFAVINNKEAALSFYIQILENGELSQETFTEAIAMCVAVKQQALDAGNNARVVQFNERMLVAEKRLVELGELLAPIPALRDALDAQINEARTFLDAVEKERGTDESLNYTQKTSEFEALFGTAEASRKALSAVQDLYIRVQTKHNQAKKSLDVCTPGEE